MQMHEHVSDCDFPILGSTVGAALTPHLTSPGTGAAALTYQRSGEAEPGCAGCAEEKDPLCPWLPQSLGDPVHVLRVCFSLGIAGELDKVRI